MQSYKKFSFRVRHLSATHEIFAIQCNKQIPCHKHFIASLIASYCILLHHFNLDRGTKKRAVTISNMSSYCLFCFLFVRQMSATKKAPDFSTESKTKMLTKISLLSDKI